MRNFVRVAGLWAASLCALALLVWGAGGPGLGGRRTGRTGAGAAGALARPAHGDGDGARAPVGGEHRPRDHAAPEASDDPAAVGAYAGAVRRGALQDDARLLTAAERQAVTSELRRVAARAGVQFAVWTVPTADVGELAERSLRKAEAMALGRRGQDDGLLLSVALAHHEARLEVGYGLEGVLPDAVCAKLLRQAFAGDAPDEAGGAQVLAAVVAVRERLEAAVADGSLQPPERRAAQAAADTAPLWPFVLALLLLLGRWGRGGGGGGRRRRAYGPPVWPLLGPTFDAGGWPSGGPSGGAPDDTRGGGGGFGGGGASSRW